MESFQHKLEKFDVGVVWLDKSKRVTALSSLAREVLAVGAGDPIGQEILQFHPAKSRDKIKWLLESSACPVGAPPPVTMLINIPDRVLLIKVCKMLGAEETIGTCMIFYDLTDLIAHPRREAESETHLRLLFKLPVYKHNKVVLLDLDEVVRFKSEGHYTDVFTRQDSYLCNLSLSDLEERLSPEQFIRVHRSHMVNIRHAASVEKSDDGFALVMNADPVVRIPVSRSNVHRLKHMLGLS